jgi:hypothetical protein
MSDLSYDIPEDIQAKNQALAAAHQDEHLPVAQSLATLANPTSSGQDRVKASNVVKNFTGSDDTRPADLLKAVSNFNVGDIYKALTGGSDQYVPAWDSNGKQYFKVYNQRTTTLNPQGELRRIEDMNGKPLSTEEIQSTGPVTSLAEVPMHDRGFFQANQITAKDAATAQAKNWNNLLDKAATGVLAVPDIKAITADNREILKRLQPFSVNPKTRTLLAGVNDLRTGNAQEFSQQLDRLNEFRKGNGSKQDWEDFSKQSGGLTLGLNYSEGKGLTNSKGQTASDEEINRNAGSARAASSSTNAISARKADLMAKAQLEAFGNDLNAFNDFQRLINNEEQKANLINSIESKGGIGIAKPNIPLQHGDSFSLARTKNEMDDAYADLLSHYSKTILGSQKSLNGRTPGIGEIETAIADNPIVRQRKQDLYKNISQIEQESKPVNAQIGAQPVNPSLLSTPTLSATNPTANSRPSAVMPNLGPATTPAAVPVRATVPTAAPVGKPKKSLAEIGKRFEVK